MENEPTRPDAESPKPTQQKKPGTTPTSGENHWMVRWAKAKELLADEHGTGELLGELQR